MRSIFKAAVGFAVGATVMISAIGAPVAAAEVQSPHDKVEAVIATLRTLQRPERVNLATIWDGNKYVQCRRMDGGALHCEAAGSLMQSSMSYVLTPERIGKLTTLGWRLDPAFGNYVHNFPAVMTNGTVADAILVALSQGYDVEMKTLEIGTNSVPDQPCPPRNRPSQNLAGMINDSKEMRSVAVHACAYLPNRDETVGKLTPDSKAADLIALLGLRVTAEISRLRVNLHERRVFAAFDTDIGYIQCEPESNPDAFYCEAQSPDSWPALASVLTPPRISALHAAGYADPGRTQNYSKSYPVDQITDAALASEVLTLLHDAYGYYGASKLTIHTEETAESAAPLTPTR